MNSTKVIFESSALARVTEIVTNDKSLITPTYFPAISSFGIKYPIDLLIRLITEFSFPRMLISAYDIPFSGIDDPKMLRNIQEYSNEGNFVFLDSGIYESFWKNDKRWTRNQYKKSMEKIEVDLFSSFDILPEVKYSSVQFKKETVKNILFSRKQSNEFAFLPILHGLSPNELINLVDYFVQKHPQLCNFIAISERDCGEYISEKIQTIIKIRKLLDTNNPRNILHILGCGNPLSMLLFAYCGANSFDSLDWIKYVFDPKSLAQYAFSQLELINCDCPICSSGKRRSYFEKALLHNLLFYQKFTMQIQQAIRNDQIYDIVRKQVNKNMIPEHVLKSN